MKNNTINRICNYINSKCFINNFEVVLTYIINANHNKGNGKKVIFLKKLKKILSVALTGVILASSSQISVISKTIDQSVYIGGEPFGVKFYNSGIIVIDLESFYNGSKYICPAKDADIQVNDIITEVNGEIISTNEELQNSSLNSNGNPLNLTIKRNGKELVKKITPQKNTAGIYVIGAWVRDSCAGIGTITYYDTDNNYFAALGHGICDSNTSALLPLGYGEVVHANISGITKSVSGKAGSLDGYFTDTTIGNLTNNSQIGIYGTIIDNYKFNKEKTEIADISEIKKGKANLITTIDGEKARSFEVEITKICNTSQQSNENFVIKVTNDELIKKCGGIVQGMSGSPIIQNGKLVGAVTHVFLNKPEEGYGIFAQNMVDYYAE